MGYEKVFEKPYSGGWKDLPDRTTPVTAAIMDDYDEAIEHIENHLNGSSAVFPIQATGGMTQPVGIDENGRLVTMPTGGGGGGTASEITYDNTESGLESTDVQGAIDELAAGAGEKVTPVQKTADMTQEVGIDENGELWTAPGGGGSSITETVILDTPVQVTVSTPITLDDAITNYDQIRIRAYMSFNGMKLWSDNLFQSDDFILGDTNDQHWIFIDNNDLCYFSMSADGTQLVVASVAGSVYIGEVVGIKFSGGSSDSWTKLLDVREESSQTASSYTLADDITNYNTIAVSGYFSHSLGTIIHVETLPIDMIEIDSSVHQICIDNSHVVTVKFPTSTSVESVGSAGGTYIYQVWGK